jgi:histidine triad (HIT) family protein
MKDVVGCILCDIAQHRAAAAVVYESNDIIAIMDLYPASIGHVLVLPKDHVEDVYLLNDALGSRIMVAAIHISRAIKAAWDLTGLNLVQANGVAAGQTIRHFHLHLVPRYHDDGINFSFGHSSEAEDPERLGGLALLIRSKLDSLR